jgi:hypothetical protein
MEWLPEEDRALAGFVAEGLSAGSIAALHFAEVRNRTRNAVMGRIHRLGLRGNSQHPEKLHNRPAMATKRLRRVVSPPGALIPSLSPVTFLELKNGHCRFVVNEGGSKALFCGDPKQDRSSYCGHHHRITHNY